MQWKRPRRPPDQGFGPPGRIEDNFNELGGGPDMQRDRRFSALGLCKMKREMA